MAGQATSSRLLPVDALRGLIMILMAVDHASFFVAKVHPSDWWGIPLPRYESAFAFLTRFVSHPCAPGFFLLLGLSMSLFAGSRRLTGWPEGRIRRYFLWRGLILIAFQLFVENPAWLLGPATGAAPGVVGPVKIYLGVLYALGMSMIIGSFFLRLPAWVLTGGGLTAILFTQLSIPGPESAAHLHDPLLRALLIPGQTGILIVKYPVVPWLGVALLGMALGMVMARDPRRAYRRFLWLGAGALALFTVVRLAGGPLGDFHPPAGPGWIDFLNLTKYPPSLAFLLVTLGIDLLLLAFLSRNDASLARPGHPLIVFGRTALFFYIVHLYIYGLAGLAFPKGLSLAWMYPFWLAGLALLYCLCSGYARFKARLTPESVWRMF